MHDLVIRNGTIIDGTGAPAFVGDVAIDGGRIAALGTGIGPGREEIDASGKLVTPGWVDIHTHFDGQVMWDPLLSPSGQHGVSTVVMGHCGVGFAPVKPEDHELLINIMEGLEDIPAATLRAGVGWRWQSFPEYLDVLEQLPRALDFATQIPHSALRCYVMGERGRKKEPATAADIDEMANQVEQALRAGALGFTTSRTKVHTTADGKHIPGSYATSDELLGIGRAMGRAGHGVFQLVSDMDKPDYEFGWMTELSREQNIPVHFILSHFDRPKFSGLLKHIEAASTQGANIFGLVGGRAIGMLITLDSDVHPFYRHPSYIEIAKLPLAERVAIMRDPQFKQRLLSETTTSTHGYWQPRMEMFETMFRLGTPPDYEPAADESIAAIAARAQRTPQDVIYDMLLERDGAEVIYNPLFSYAENSFAPLQDMLEHSNTLMSLADGGAHLGIMSDAAMPTFMLTHWVRDRTRGARFPLEKMVMMQTSQTAAAYGLNDRGRLAVGYKADVNVIDFENLQLEAPYWVHDLPANGRRFMQHARGYDATVVSGVITTRHGEATGALPGKLIRGPQRIPS
jgi:N-acyl-D-aspartate/D-glutamate deacylase